VVHEMGYAKLIRNTKKESNFLKRDWGRRCDTNSNDSIISFIMLTFPMLLIGKLYYVCEEANCSITDANLIPSFEIPQITGLFIIVIFYIFQILLYILLPGRMSEGQLTPAGHKITYKINGLLAWMITNAMYLLLSIKFKLFSPTLIADMWGSIIFYSSIFGLSICALAYLKGVYFPTHPQDCRITGRFLYDFYMGVELNPSIKNYDFKLFNNGRTGLMAWSLINFSMLFKQYATYGYVNNSMILVNILQAIYIIDFYFNEDWYPHTMDINHDHFGFYVIWGCNTWLPFIYTFQAYYLTKNPMQLSWPYFVLLLIIGCIGYYIFRDSNHQKFAFRHSTSEKEYLIWGKKPIYIEAKYYLLNGKAVASKLLTSGWWGISRHMNYFGDLLQALAYCLACGSQHIAPYTYVVYLSILLFHRIHRDDKRCSRKYGKFWNLYCSYYISSI